MLDDTSGPTIIDSSVNANHGTAMGSLTLGNSGQVGTSAGFDGSTAYVDMGVLTDFDDLPAITVEAWINVSAYTTYGGSVVGQTTNNLDVDFALIIDDAPAGSVWWISSSTDTTYGYRSIQTASGFAPLDTWVHVAGVYEVSTNTRLIYVNGVAVAPETSLSFGDDVAAPMDGTGPLRIGNYVWNGSTDTGFFNGFIDDVKIWDVVRTQEQICSDAGGTPDGYGGCTLE
jgi:hypothetical protein